MPHNIFTKRQHARSSVKYINVTLSNRLIQPTNRLPLPTAIQKAHCVQVSGTVDIKRPPNYTIPHCSITIMATMSSNILLCRQLALNFSSCRSNRALKKLNTCIHTNALKTMHRCKSLNSWVLLSLLLLFCFTLMIWWPCISTVYLLFKVMLV